ncbi:MULTISPECIES: hypothetical protein [unclassified Micromonospora]|uniref:hypothetical protein n=1 Tax=unclassified Micromonospora TaxID=2617518 RepID=UPI002E1EB6BA
MSPTLLRLGRITAVAISAGTLAFLVPNWTADNLFLVPDLLLSATLLAAAALPARHARTALLAAFCFAAGVLITAVASYAVQGRIGIGSLVGAVAAVAMGAAFLRLRSSAGSP